MLSSSDNDAAKEIARRAGGSRGAEGFIADMNKLAKDKGLNNTAFTNASGEPEAGMFSTAADMAKWQFLLVKDFPKESMKYSATEKVATAKNAGITKDDCQTYKTGTGEGFHGVCNQGNRVGGRSGVGTVDVNRDGIADGAFAIAEVKTGESADYTAIAKKIAATSKGLSHSDVGSADMNRFPPQETPPSKDILQVAKAAK